MIIFFGDHTQKSEFKQRCRRTKSYELLKLLIRELIYYLTTTKNLCRMLVLQKAIKILPLFHYLVYILIAHWGFLIFSMANLHLFHQNITTTTILSCWWNMQGCKYVCHSSEIRGLCLMKLSSKMLQNLPYLWSME